MAFDITKPSMTAANWAAALGDIRENFRAVIAGEVPISGNLGIGALPSGNPGKLHIYKASTYTNEISSAIRIDSATGASPDTTMMIGTDPTSHFSFIQSLQSAISFTTRPLWLQPNGGSVSIGGATSVTGILTLLAATALRMENASSWEAKNSTGTYETVFIGRYSDNVTYLNFGSAGLMIRTNGASSVLNMDASNNVGFINSGVTTPSYGAGAGVVFIANRATAPSANPTGGGIVYVEAGALKFRGSAGTVTTVAPA